MKTVTREEFVNFTFNQDFEENMIEGTTISALQFTKNGTLMAQAIYQKPVQRPGVKVIRTYQIKD